MNKLLFAFPIVAMLAQLLPVIAVAPQWQKVEPVRRWIAVWGMVFFLSDILQLAVSGLHTNNLWLYIFTNPVEDGIVLFALSFWQVRPVARIAYRVAIPLFIFTYLSIAFGVGDSTNFQAVAGPFRAFVVLSATLFTLISRVAQAPEDVGSRDWFWATVGIALYYGALVAVEPISAAMQGDFPALRAVYSVKAALDTIAFILIWRGMRCPLRNGSSGST